MTKPTTLALCHARIQEFSSGGVVQVSLTKKALTTFFFCFFLVLSLFSRSQMVNFKEIYHFQGFRGGPTFSRGVQLFPGGGGGGSNCLFPIETHITCDFPGGVRTPCPTSGFALVCASMRPPKTLIRLGGCPECPESSIGKNSKWFVVSCLRKYYGHIS